MLTVAIAVLTLAGVVQLTLGVLVLTSKFDPLLPHERKILPTKARKRARLANAVSMIGCGIILITFALGILIGSQAVQIASGVALAIFIVIMLAWSLRIEAKYFK